jgi:chromosome segregation ATPase
MSFSEMMSSGRGPGVIGMLLAMVVLVGFGTLFMFAFDEGFQGTGGSIEFQIKSQEREIDSCQGSVKRGQTSLAVAPNRIAKANTLATITKENQAEAEKITALKAKIQAANTELAAAGQTWEAYKDRYREFIRSKAKGEVIDKLETRNGVVYNNASIREVTAVGIQIRHDDGQKRIPFEELSDELQDFYQFDPAQKQKAVAAEITERDKHDAAVAVVSDQVDQQMALKRQQEDAEAKEKLQREIAEKQAQITSIEAEITGLERDRTQAESEAQAARAAGKMHLNKSGRITSQIASKQARISSLRAEIVRMSAKL